ncbi:hypothetical protein [Nocardia colli]
MLIKINGSTVNDVARPTQVPSGHKVAVGQGDVEQTEATMPPRS